MSTSSIDVRVIRDIVYASNEPHQPGRQSLDLYLPINQSNDQSPALFVYIHGGLWMDRDKADYANIGQTWAKRGVAVAVVNYRETSHEENDQSSVIHPTHTRDLANALHFLTQQSISDEHKYDSRRIVLVGHSCGAHMAGLVTLDPFLMTRTTNQSTNQSYVSDPTYFDLMQRLVGCVGIEGLYHMTKWCADFPDWRGDIDKVFINPEPEWLEPVNVPPPNVNCIISRAKWLLIHSSEDAWVNAAQHESMIDHLRSHGLNGALHSIKGGHFAVVDNIGTADDVITDKVFEFVSSLKQ